MNVFKDDMSLLNSMTPVLRNLRHVAKRGRCALFSSAEKQLWDAAAGKAPIKLFDVTLRDGLQGRPPLPLGEKQALFQRVLNSQEALSIEIGSLVSPSVVPQMAESDELYRFARGMVEQRRRVGRRLPDLYLLVPPSMRYARSALSLSCLNISIPASVSEDFQQKNVRKSRDETYAVVKELSESNKFSKIKVYLSCVSECPVAEKRIPEREIVEEAARYMALDGVAEVCLSDTMGTLNSVYLEYILWALTKADPRGMQKVSLHLHESDDEGETQLVLSVALSYGIRSFDVSRIETGGCFVTMGQDACHANLSHAAMKTCADRLGIEIDRPMATFLRP